MQAKVPVFIWKRWRWWDWAYQLLNFAITLWFPIVFLKSKSWITKRWDTRKVSLLSKSQTELLYCSVLSGSRPLQCPPQSLPLLSTGIWKNEVDDRCDRNHEIQNPLIFYNNITIYLPPPSESLSQYNLPSLSSLQLLILLSLFYSPCTHDKICSFPTWAQFHLISKWCTWEEMY